LKILSGIVATTHIDKHFERLSLGTLESMAEQANSSYIPNMVEHDPRIPPKGRMASARVIKLPDGEYGLETVTEEFEPGEHIKFRNNGREIPVHQHSPDTLDLRFDRNFRNPEDQQLIGEISEVFGSEPEEEGKKSLDPLTVLTLGGMFILGGIAKGFFSKLGSDGYEKLRDRLKKLMRLKPEEQEKLLRFEFTVQEGDAEIVAEAILTNPSDEEVEGFLKDGLAALDEKVKSLFALSGEVKKTAFEYKEGNLNLKFAVRKDAVPLLPVQVKARLDRARKKQAKQMNKKRGMGK
jgi:hypothetical protein